MTGSIFRKAQIWEGCNVEELKDRFRAWLDGNDYKPFVIGKNNGGNLYVKIPRGDDFDYLFEDYLESDLNVDRQIKLKYCGIYHKSEHKLYDARGWFKTIDPTLEADHGLSNMADDVQDKVRELIENRLQNDIHNLDVQTISTKRLRQDLQYAEQYGASEKARKLFLLHAEPDDVRFECEYEFGILTDTFLLAYLSDSETFCHDQAMAYWAEHQEDMCLQFMINDVVRNELAELNALDDSPLHRIREISEAVTDVSASTVSVTIYKDGNELTFRSDASQLRCDPGNHYSLWFLPAKDRAAFRSLFGPGADFSPEDITQITYYGKTVYEASPFEPQEDEGFELSM